MIEEQFVKDNRSPQHAVAMRQLGKLHLDFVQLWIAGNQLALALVRQCINEGMLVKTWCNLDQEAKTLLTFKGEQPGRKVRMRLRHNEKYENLFAHQNNIEQASEQGSTEGDRVECQMNASSAFCLCPGWLRTQLSFSIGRTQSYLKEDGKKEILKQMPLNSEYIGSPRTTFNLSLHKKP